ncbi:DNA recombination protein RmuC [Euryarchaeota archaeon]|nr:DNA recombination protein RmuC [Candidatus Thalassarchaeum sp.]MDC3282064.1 DNA recombination protein RmuC [Euryarchaeota archaeon]
MADIEMIVIAALTFALIIALWQLINNSSSSNDIEIRKEIREMGAEQMNTLQALGSSQQEHLATVSRNIERLKEGNEKKLDQMRETVDEKLQETLEKRITASFQLVSKQLQDVHSGLGEMKNLADDVGGLKKVLSNVSTRGALGELQAHQILENFLSPEQFGINVQTNPNYNGTVEFAVALPGYDDSDEILWLPIDCKFPIEDHQAWLDALDIGDKDLIETARKSLVSNVKKKAKDISQKYISPPHTTDFAIMFLPTEGLYADIARQPSLLEILQREHQVMICGPSNLSAFISSIKVGFRTLALKESAGDVWRVLGAVKNEYAKFGKTIESAHKTANALTNKLSIEGEVQVRLRAMDRALKDIETLSAKDSAKLLDLPDDNQD